MTTNRQKVQEVYQNKAYWKPPSLMWIAKKLGISKALVARYVKELGK